jgi:hypothetical protein
MISLYIFHKRRVLCGKCVRHLPATTFGKVLLVIDLFLFYFASRSFAIGQARYVDFIYSQGSFSLAQKGDVAVLYVDSQNHPGVVRAVKDLQADVARVTNNAPNIVQKQTALEKNTVIIGTIGKSQIIDQLAKDGKIDVNHLWRI